jgi:paraquat-inducible protein B
MEQDTPYSSADDALPTPHVQRRSRLPRLIWIVPIVAALVGLSLIFKAWHAAGPKIVIFFPNAEGIEVGKTLVKERNVTIGSVSDIALSDDRQSVMVTADLTRSGENAAREGSIFWVVRPRISVGGASGLDTLLTGSYIGVEPGSSKSHRERFVAQDKPPPLSHQPDGRQVALRAVRAGSLAIGTPVYFRQFQVGRVIDLSLSPDGTASVIIFVDAPNDKFLTVRTRFWNSSGLEVKLGGDGVDIKAESIASVIGGGIAFDDGPPDYNGEERSMQLFKNETEAMTPPSGDPRYIKMRFAHAFRGLKVDAAVEFMGINIGSVASVDLDYDAQQKTFPLVVVAKIFPQRMGRAFDTMVRQGAAQTDSAAVSLFGQLVARGLSAQPRSSSLLSDSLYVALDFSPNRGKVKFDPAAQPLEVPTIPSSTDDLETRLSSIAKKLDELPLHDIAANLNTDLKDIHGTLEQVKGQVLPDLTDTLHSANSALGGVDQLLSDRSPFREHIDSTLDEAQRSLSSIRDLADFLDRHPEALIRGRRESSISKDAPQAEEK